MLVSWNITKACNLKCKHCYRDAGKKDREELNLKEAKKLISEIASVHFKTLILSGGEPLLRKDIYEIISFAASLGLRPVLGTNGTLITEKTAGELKRAGLVRAGISLDSLDSKSHDEFRQKKGAWRLAVKAMRVCKNEGLDFQVHTTVWRHNFRQILKLTDFAYELGARGHHVFFFIPAGRGKEIYDFLLPSEDYKGLLSCILKKQKESRIELKPVCAPQFVPLAESLGLAGRFKRGCLAGISYCCILPNGDLHPCPYLPIKLGNVREMSFGLIWRKAEIFMKLRSLDYGGKCAACGYKDSCGGCRARAYFHSGDFMGEDPACCIC